MNKYPERQQKKPPIIYILSGGVGASGEQVVNTVLAQFPDHQIEVRTLGNLRSPGQLDAALATAASEGGIVVHTMVDPLLRRRLVDMAAKRGIPAMDLMGPLMEWIFTQTGAEPLGRPGRYRLLHADYFDRVAAIEYTMAHDDGMRREGWPKADIVLIGVSRAGKTPLSLYLSVLGWCVANVPFVPGIPLPEELFALDLKRVVGLIIEPGQLIQHRLKRQARLGVLGPSDYIDPVTVHSETQEAKRIFRRHGFAIVNVTDKPIEASADDVIRLMNTRFPEKGNR